MELPFLAGKALVWVPTWISPAYLPGCHRATSTGTALPDPTPAESLQDHRAGQGLSQTPSASHHEEDFGDTSLCPGVR